MKQSKAYVSFKARTQEIFNFAVLVTISVPALKQSINLYKKGLINKLPDPDYFEPSVIYEITSATIESLKKLGLEDAKIQVLKQLEKKPLNNREFKDQVTAIVGEIFYKANRNEIKKQSITYVENIESCTSSYQTKLATYLYFSMFSYFEAYINDLANEIVSSFKKLDKSKYFENHKINNDLISDRLKLDKKYDPRKIERYLKFSKVLRGKGYSTPEEIIFPSVLDLLISKIDDLKANQIPEFIEKIFMYKMSKEEKEEFDNIRSNRNSIGHGGKLYNPSLKDVIKANKFMKTLSNNIDKHVAFHFYRPQNFSYDL